MLSLLAYCQQQITSERVSESTLTVSFVQLILLINDRLGTNKLNTRKKNYVSNFIRRQNFVKSAIYDDTSEYLDHI